MRWNDTTHIFEMSTNDGASWAVLPLNASVINEGAINAARLPANVVLTNVNNPWAIAQSLPSGSQINGANSQFGFYDSSGPVDNRRWRFVQYGDGALRLECLNDANSILQAGSLALDRLGNVNIGNNLLAGLNLFEKGRAFPIGHFVNTPFNAADYSGTGGTWTIGAAAVITNRYTVIGKTCIWQLYISWFSGGNICSGAALTAVNIKLPGGFAGGPNPFSIPVAYVVDAGAIVDVTAGINGGAMQFTRKSGNFAAGPSASSVGLMTILTFEIA